MVYGSASNVIPPWKKFLFVLLKTLIMVGLLAHAYALAVYLYPPLFPATLVVVGRASLCPTVDAVLGSHQRYRLFLAAKETNEQISMIRSDPAGYALWRTPIGDFWVPDKSALAVLVAQQVVDDYGAGNRAVQPGDVVLDCGAHVGVYTRKALDSGARLVVAIEPAASNVECLRRNFCAEIESGRVIVYPKGVWDETALLPLYEDPLNSAANSFLEYSGRAAANRYFEVTTIDNLVDELKLTAVDRIKMDIKGAVERALRGAARTLERHKPALVIATEEAEDNPERIVRLIDQMSLGYRMGCGTCFFHDWTLYPQVLFFQ